MSYLPTAEKQQWTNACVAIQEDNGDNDDHDDDIWAKLPIFTIEEALDILDSQGLDSKIPLGWSLTVKTRLIWLYCSRMMAPSESPSIHLLAFSVLFQDLLTHSLDEVLRKIFSFHQSLLRLFSNDMLGDFHGHQETKLLPVWTHSSHSLSPSDFGGIYPGETDGDCCFLSERLRWQFCLSLGLWQWRSPGSWCGWCLRSTKYLSIDLTQLQK